MTSTKPKHWVEEVKYSDGSVMYFVKCSQGVVCPYYTREQATAACDSWNNPVVETSRKVVYP